MIKKVLITGAIIVGFAGYSMAGTIDYKARIDSYKASLQKQYEALQRTQANIVSLQSKIELLEELKGLDEKPSCETQPIPTP